MGCPKITLVQNLTPTNTVVGVALVVPIVILQSRTVYKGEEEEDGKRRKVCQMSLL